VVAVGGPRLLAKLGAEADPAAGAWGREERTVLHVIADGRVLGALAVEDEIRPESAEAIERLHAMGIKVAMITGDSQVVADSVARRLGIAVVTDAAERPLATRCRGRFSGIRWARAQAGAWQRLTGDSCRRLRAMQPTWGSRSV
jgi:magnesium-transporting ATPase (P-type)